jgi:hypothetical protein
VPTPFWGPDFAALEKADPEIAEVVLGELSRLRGGLQLIASENLTSPAELIGAAVRGEDGVGDRVRVPVENFPAYA